MCGFLYLVAAGCAALLNRVDLDKWRILANFVG